MIRTSYLAGATLLALLSSGEARAQRPQTVLDRDGGTIVLEPYAPNIVRVTLSLLKEPATAAPGYGFVASPSSQGWSRQQNAEGDVYRSSRLVVTVAVNRPRKPMATELDIAKFFNGSAPATHITVAAPGGKKLAEMTDWSMSTPNHKDGNAGVLNDKRPSDAAFYQVGATFVSPDDEHYYGLGQSQEGYLDHRGHRIECWQSGPAPLRSV
jgi:alpha-D-xyloside xylohydrolase